LQEIGARCAPLLPDWELLLDGETEEIKALLMSGEASVIDAFKERQVIYCYLLFIAIIVYC
jgi:hypothetical protein